LIFFAVEILINFSRKFSSWTLRSRLRQWQQW